MRESGGMTVASLINELMMNEGPDPRLLQRGQGPCRWDACFFQLWDSIMNRHSARERRSD